MLCACNSASLALSFPQFCHYTSFLLHDLPPISLLHSFSLSFPRVWQQETITLTDGISLLQFLSVCLPSSLSLTRSPSCAFAVLFPPTHSAPSLLLFCYVFSWVDVIGIYRTLPERERENWHTLQNEKQTAQYTRANTPRKTNTTDQSHQQHNSTKQTHTAQMTRANKYKPIHASNKQHIRANKHKKTNKSKTERAWTSQQIRCLSNITVQINALKETWSAQWLLFLKNVFIGINLFKGFQYITVFT